jgi:hypothetical protein
MFVVKRLGKNGMWSAVSLIDKNGSFRGEAKFETRKEADEYMADYLQRMKSRQRVTPEGYGEVRVFDESKQGEVEEKKKPVKAKKKKTR